MSVHKPVISQHMHAPGVSKSAYRYYVTCTCRTASNLQLTKQEAEDWQFTHLQNVERTLANLHRGRGSLKTDMDHAAAMLADPHTTEADKVAWQIIYDGARKRLGLPDPTKPTPTPHEQLW